MSLVYLFTVPYTRTYCPLRLPCPSPQGVSAALGEAVHLTEVRRQLLHTAHVAMEWLHRRCPHITNSAFYLVEPLPPEQVCVYTHVHTTWILQLASP